MSHGRDTRKIKDRLAAGERVFVDKAHMEKVLEMIPHTTLHMKLQYLREQGVVETSPSRYLLGGKALTYKGRKIRIVSDFKGKSKWEVNGEKDFEFTEPHDLAVDSATKRVLAFARS